MLRIAKYGVFCLFIIVLCMPLIQQNFELFELEPIVGDFELPKKPECNEQTIWSGEFQEKYNEYFKFHIGFREFLVRIYNQIAYNLFYEAHMTSALIGKNNQLYQDVYIDSYAGTDFIGDSLINEQCTKLKKIQDTLSKKGIHFLVVIAPNKAYFFPEYIPDQYHEILNKKLPTNYQAFCKALPANKINFIDFNKWFIEHKNKTKYPLYPQGGVHWSLYGKAIAADTLMTNMKRISGENYSDVKMIGAEVRDANPIPDRDLAEGMNLIVPLKAYKTAFPVMRFDTIGKVKPNVLTIADSYYNNLRELGLIESTFSPQSSNWDYFSLSHNTFTDQYHYVNELNIQKEIEQCDFVIIISTVHNLKRFGWGFIDNVYGIYFKK